MSYDPLPPGYQPPPPSGPQPPRFEAPPPPPWAASQPPPPPFNPQPPPPQMARGQYFSPPTVHAGHLVPEGSKSYVATVLLSFFFGIFGADRFYLGKTQSAIVKLVTLGGFGYWWLIDLGITLFGGQRDQWGLRLAGYDKHKKTVWLAIGAFFGISVAYSLLMGLALAAFGPDGPTPFGWMLFTGLAAAGIATGSVWLKRRRAVSASNPKPVAAPTRPTAAPPRRVAAPSRPVAAPPKPEFVPPSIQAQIDKLTTLRQRYVLHAASGNQSAAVVVDQLESLIPNMSELFRRLHAKADQAERGFAQTEYEDKLGKLIAALDRDYLLDLLTNPHLWDNPEKRVQDVLAALQAVTAELLENIKQVNALKALKFEVALDQLLDPDGLAGWTRAGG